MDIKNLQTFMTIVQEGSYSRAAEKLNYTQSTITFQIDQLEKEFHVKLFEKVGRRMRLTQSGEQFVPYVEKTLDDLAKLYAFQESLSDYQGELHIGTLESLLCYQLPPMFQKFTQIAPHAKIFIHVMECEEVVSALQRGVVDIGFFYADEVNVPAKIETAFIEKYTVGMFASPAVRAQYPDFISGGCTIPLPLIADMQSSPFRRMLERYLHEKNIHLDHVIEVGSVHTMKRLCEADMGLTVLPHFTAVEELELGSLVEIPTAMPRQSVTAVCGYSKDRWISPAMQMLIDLCTLR